MSPVWPTGTSYTYYVRCRDTLGNANPNSFLISFSVATPSVVATPVITPNGGSSNTPANVTLFSSTAGASIYYTTNGNPPTIGLDPVHGPVHAQRQRHGESSGG